MTSTGRRSRLLPAALVAGAIGVAWPVLVPVAVVPMLACVETMNVSGVVGVQIAR